MSDIPNDQSEVSQEPEFTDPFDDGEFDDDAVAKAQASWENLLADADVAYAQSLGEVAEMTPEQQAYLANVGDLPDPATDGLDDTEDMPPEFREMEGPAE
jgi:hypothetical protein